MILHGVVIRDDAKETMSPLKNLSGCFKRINGRGNSKPERNNRLLKP
jgi:hypothetical protein